MIETEKQKLKIKKLIKLNDELENYFRNTIIPQLFVDADLILRKYTPPAMKQFKFTPDHIGKPMIELVDNIKYSTLMDNIKEVIDTEIIFEKEIQTTDLRWFQMNIVPYIIKKTNKPNGVIITFVDITDRINVLAELESLNTSHETFIYSVSHDLKGPLSNIDGLVKFLIESSDNLMKKHGEKNDEQKEIAEMLEHAVSGMKTIINELADIAKIEGNYKESTERINFAYILTEVELTLKNKIKKSSTNIHYDIKVPDISFSKKNLRSIIYNLLSNAIKYKSIDTAPEIFIKTSLKDDFVVISVKDNGIGIDQQKVKLLFSQFTRFETNVEGTGIGLYLVKKIIENAGGKIEVKSKFGNGTTFEVYLKNV